MLIYTIQSHDIYEQKKVHKKKPARGHMSTHTHQGRKMGGVLEKLTGEDITKVIEVWSIGQIAVDRHADMKFSADSGF